MTPETPNLPWIESPFFAKDLEASSLNREDKAFVKSFSDNGFVVFDTGIDHTVIDALNESMAAPFAKLEKVESRRIQDAWKYNEYVRKVASHDVVYDKLRLLYQREPIPFQTLNFPEGSQQKTHSDMVHFNSIPQRFMCGVWIALEDITPDNGPLHYYPGSHKLPFYEMIDLGIKASDNIETKKAMMTYAVDYVNFIEKMVKALELKKEVLTIKKGQGMIWAANLLHGGERIKKPGASRLTQVSHYYFEDCIYYTPRLSDIAINKLYITDLVNISTGKKIPNKYFGETIRQPAKLYLQQNTIRMLSKVSHLFPKELVTKVKSIIQR